ncbi:MAG: type II toxin-antitoxin system VapC family toxin [Candidatus Thiodiazotropha sp. (ex Rostrolucina anterorostrata)]|nr:type II toxin-antitoxin system VapC family toxin [Candidatus Thiodiazotropha sp. (ex Rostrolucina anterorostrata)]
MLLDTHTLLWWLEGDRRLSVKARAAIRDEKRVVAVSAASAWEIATKVRIGKLPGAIEVAEQLVDIISQQNFLSLPISIEHARRAGLLPGEHRDPFDRMLIAQAQIEGYTLVSNEKLFDRFGIERLW